ncbi:LacI family transcriptional regulator [Kribbella amoyensis]|uniref:LacI family transcriptional regulator n=1 Tax=Kribbella amoyensis TaxID=996641 RepID=A0A561BXB3_9ACTN|nr:LacI family DNA-binding transcriptional regulator [Kribbella amoyensis]TWD83529.1 LacI family transcriptional regulator [Kribbella amoyensis]
MAQGRASIRDVAERAGVSVSTVSRILNGSYSPAPKTRDRVMRAVQELSYVANPHARALIRQESTTVAMVLRMLDDGFLLKVVQSIAAELAAAGRLCLIGTTGVDAERELEVLEQMRGQGVQSIILIGAVVETEEYRDFLGRFAASLSGSGTRLVLCARPPIDEAPGTSVVEYDNEGGAYAATSHLLVQGHRRILHLGGPEGQNTSLQRLAGYRRAIEALGGDADPALEAGQAWDRETGYQRMRAVLQDGTRDFTAVATYTDNVAAGAIQAIREAGLRVPEDLSIIGFDDAAFAADLRLSTVHIPAQQLGQIAAQMATGERNADTRLKLGTHLVLRESVTRRTT